MSALPKFPEYDYSNRLSRQYHQPQGIADFVLIDPQHYQNYSNMVRLYDKLPTGIAMAKDKAEPTNRFYSRTQVADFTHFTPNIKKFIHSLIFDLDPIEGEFNFMKWAEVGLPPPNIIICNPDKPNSVQYIYLLAFPVRPEQNPNAKTYLDSVYACMRDLLGADRHFARTRSKNPFNASHDTYVSGAESYNLPELADKCDLELYNANKPVLATLSLTATTIPPRPQKARIEQLEPNNAPKFNDKAFPDSEYWTHGRNGETFNIIRHEGYANAHLTPDDLYNFLFDRIRHYQKRFDTPLCDRECGEIAKSIRDYCVEQFGAGTGERNPTFAKTSKFSPSATAKFSIKQRNRVNKRWTGYKDKKSQAVAMLKSGIKQVDICKQLEIGKATLCRWKKEIIPIK